MAVIFDDELESMMAISRGIVDAPRVALGSNAALGFRRFERLTISKAPALPGAIYSDRR